jgi:hypothetical protein
MQAGAVKLVERALPPPCNKTWGQPNRSSRQLIPSTRINLAAITYATSAFLPASSLADKVSILQVAFLRQPRNVLRKRQEAMQIGASIGSRGVFCCPVGVVD